MQFLSEIISEGVAVGAKKLIDYDETCPIEIYEDFVAFSTTSGQIGYAGWNFGNGTIATLASPAGRPGTFTRTSGATSAQVAHMSHGYSPFMQCLQFAEMDYMVAAFQLNTTTLFDFRIGVSSDWSSAAPSNAVFIEKLAADTTFFGVCRNGGGQTRSSAITGTIAAATWYKIRIQRLTSTTIQYQLSVAGAAYGTAVTVAANAPDSAGGAGNLGFQIVPTSAAAKSCIIDLMKYRSIGFAR